MVVFLFPLTVHILSFARGITSMKPVRSKIPDSPGPQMPWNRSEGGGLAQRKSTRRANAPRTGALSTLHVIRMGSPDAYRLSPVASVRMQ